MTIPRHGSRPSPVPRQWSADQPLPGAVNVALFDGHGELVKLDRLWQLYWHVELPAAQQAARLAVKVRGWVEADGVAAKPRADIVSRFGGLGGGTPLVSTCWGWRDPGLDHDEEPSNVLNLLP